MQNRYAIRSSRVVTPTGETSAAIVIVNGLISEVTNHDNLPNDVEVVDFGDLVISPGIVDAQSGKDLKRQPLPRLLEVSPR